jgi:alpha-tubulin suppressor-like RCC1 family protein
VTTAATAGAEAAWTTSGTRTRRRASQDCRLTSARCRAVVTRPSPSTERETCGLGATTSTAIGDGNHHSVSAAVRVPGLTNVKHVESGADHTVAVTGDGRVYTWGRNRYGQLGTQGAPTTTGPDAGDAMSGVCGQPHSGGT